MNGSMDDSPENTIEDELDHKFARDIIRFVLSEIMLGLHWIPTGMFAKQDADSPFTPEFKDAVVKELDNNGHNIHLIYDIYFPDKSLVKSTHYSVCWIMKCEFVRRNFDKEYFLKFCVVLANYAGLSYLYGAQNAPAESYTLLLLYIRELKLLRKVGDKFWNMMQKWLNGQETVEDEFDYLNALEDASEESHQMED
ncbi:hypothetical protein AVEN_70228-1 [Araneus ventricosus]|uniref:Uncharacterized protein n=1 Tax=Araneus ventricosus TaxID=182803 RepID=A0A4Y2GBL6_ARAVE|nr:hypothetical protein AVEN_70228-1 [Araneus ventricosus]